MTGGRQAVALDGVGEYDGGTGVVDAVERVEQQPQVVPAQIGEGGGQPTVVEAGDQRGQGGGGAARARQPFAQLGGGAAQQVLVLLVGHQVESCAQLGPAAGQGEQFLQPGAVLQGQALPACRLEHARQSLCLDAGHHSVQGLPVEVHHPDDLTQVGGHRVAQRLPHSALVELGVTDQGELAATPLPTGVRVVTVEVAAGHRAPQRCGGAEADRAGGVVDLVRVLGAAGVALQPAEGTESGEIRGIQAA